MRLFCAKCCHAYTVGELLQLSTIGESFGLSGGNCSKCSAGDAFFFYDNWKPDSVDNSDIEALKQYWKYKVQEFNIFIHSEEGQCMECGREVDIDTAYVKESGHGSGKLICRACVDKYLGANILDELREDPHYIGRSVLRNARNFVNGQYNHKLIEEMKTVSSTESKSTAPKESTNTIKKSTGDDSNVDIRWGKTLTYDHPFINPKTAIGFVGRGDSYAEKGEYDLAISDYSKALELNPLDPMFVHAYFNRGVAYFQKGKYNQAIADFTKVIEIKPTDADARFRRAAAYLFKGEYDKAWEDVHKAQNLGCQVNAKFLKVLREASGRER
jgi:tetratricopeptide (TPR) repeat protein